MSERTTKRDLEEAVARINRRWNAGLALNWAYGKPRVTNLTESRDISPRLPKGELAIWLDGYYSALDRAEDLNAERNRGPG